MHGLFSNERLLECDRLNIGMSNSAALLTLKDVLSGVKNFAAMTAMTLRAFALLQTLAAQFENNFDVLSKPQHISTTVEAESRRQVFIVLAKLIHPLAPEPLFPANKGLPESACLGLKFVFPFFSWPPGQFLFLAFRPWDCSCARLLPADACAAEVRWP